MFTEVYVSGVPNAFGLPRSDVLAVADTRYSMRNVVVMSTISVY